MKKLYEPPASIISIKYKPDNEVITENPPRFMWVPPFDEDVNYKLQISTSNDFPDDCTKTYTGIPYNFFTLSEPLKPARYFWRYSVDDSVGEYSYGETRTFEVSNDAVETPIPDWKERISLADKSHPRLWLNSSEIEDYAKTIDTNEHFKRFYENAVLPYIDAEFPNEPKPYPNNKKVIAIWRQNYMDCQKAYNMIRNMSFAGVVKKDDKLINKAKEWLLEIAKWDVNGATNRNYNDECAFRVVGALGFGYDWLYNYMTDDERKLVLDSLFIRTKQVADHVMINSRIHFSLYDSHAIRSLSSVLTPCCIAMLGDNDEAAHWLNYTVDYLSVIYTPWGGEEGGWAEGPLYWTTAMAFVFDAISLIKNYLKIDLFKRPFFQKTGDYILHANPHDTYRVCFGDQSNIGQKPGLKTAFNIRLLAGITRNENYAWFFEKVNARESFDDTSFFNTGWWDFYFDNMMYHAQYNANNPVAPVGTQVKWFKDIGWVSINKDMSDENNHIFFLTKASPYGCVSHSHGDHSSFLLFAYGEPLVILSGYYIGFNSSMHLHWRRQTISHNTLLINGKGQYAGMDKTLQLSATGTVIDACENYKGRENLVYIKENPTQAYLTNGVSELKDFTREIYFVDNAYFVIVDKVSLNEPGEVDWLLHSLTQFEIKSNKFIVEREKAKLRGKFVYVSSGIGDVSQTDSFDGVDEAELEGLDMQWHFKMKTKKALNHTIVTCLVPLRTDEETTVSDVIDDQGHNIFVYFSRDGKSFTLEIDKSVIY